MSTPRLGKFFRCGSWRFGGTDRTCRHRHLDQLSRILSFAYLPGRAADALFTLVGALILTSAALVPHQSELAFRIETLAIGLVMFFAPGALQVRIMKAGHSIPTMWSFTRALLSSAPSIPIVVAGALLMLGWGGGLYWIAAGVILSLVAGILTAWVLLIEILRRLASRKRRLALRRIGASV